MRHAAPGRAGVLGDQVKVTKDKTKVTVTSESEMSKRCARAAELSAAWEVLDVCFSSGARRRGCVCCSYGLAASASAERVCGQSDACRRRGRGAPRLLSLMCCAHLRLHTLPQVSQVPDEEVPEEAQRAGLAAGHRIQQGPQARARRTRCHPCGCCWAQRLLLFLLVDMVTRRKRCHACGCCLAQRLLLCLSVDLVTGHCAPLLALAPRLRRKSSPRRVSHAGGACSRAASTS